MRRQQMSEVIKLSDAHGYTGHATASKMLWGEGVTNHAKGEGVNIFTNSVIHAFRTPLLAVLMDQQYSNHLQRGGIAWLANGEIVADDGLRIGCKSLTTVHRVELPKVTTVQRAAFGILSVMEAPHNPKWRAWAEDWLSGKDRSSAAARRAERAAWKERPPEVAEAWAMAAGATAAGARGEVRAAAAGLAAVWARAASWKIIDFAAIAEKAMKYGGGGK